MAATKKYQGAPFGTQTARFDVTGVHPKTKVPGSFTQIPYDKYSMEELDTSEKLHLNHDLRRNHPILTIENFEKLHQLDTCLDNTRKSLNEAFKTLNQNISELKPSKLKSRLQEMQNTKATVKNVTSNDTSISSYNRKGRLNKDLSIATTRSENDLDKHDDNENVLERKPEIKSILKNNNCINNKNENKKNVSLKLKNEENTDSEGRSTLNETVSSVPFSERSRLTSINLRAGVPIVNLADLNPGLFSRPESPGLSYERSTQSSTHYQDLSSVASVQLTVKRNKINMLRSSTSSSGKSTSDTSSVPREKIKKEGRKRMSKLNYIKGETCEEQVKRKLGPGTYKTMIGGFSTHNIDAKASGPGWARQLEVERLAALPHLLYKEQWEENRMLKRKLGPGSYEIKDFIQSADQKPRSHRGICQNLAERFEKGFQSITPGPGTYGMGGVPQRAIEEKSKVSASQKGILDAGDRKRNLPSVGSELGPGTYKHKTCTDEMIKKVTSLKGPYELYSGDRNQPIAEGYLAAPKLADLGPGQYEINSFVDEWKGKRKSMHGKFGKMAQYPEVPTDRIFLFSQAHFPKAKDSPAPGAYTLQNLSKPRHLNNPGFQSSAKRDDKMYQKFFTKNYNAVGAGRYDIQKYEEAQDINGHQSIFKSKSGKPSMQAAKFLQERIRAKDVRKEDNVCIQSSERPTMHRSFTIL